MLSGTAGDAQTTGKIRIVQPNEVHISSMVVLTRPESLQAVKEFVERLPGTEIHGECDTGKLVVVLESDRQTCITDVIETISKFEPVLSAALVYHQIEQLDSQETDLL
jgi:nitrate reductase NapD